MSSNGTMAKEEVDDLLPDKDAAKGFYAKYEPKEILGRLVHCFVRDNFVFNKPFVANQTTI